MSTCAGCGTAIEQLKRGRRKWCSHRCRKRTLYGGTCKLCGAVTNGYDGPGTAAEVCRDCRDGRNAERNAEIVERWNEGEPEWYIAEEMGLRPTQVGGAIETAREQGKEVALHRKRSREDWPEIERLYRSGLPLAEIGERVGISVASVSARLAYMRRAGIDLPYRRNRRTAS